MRHRHRCLLVLGDHVLAQPGATGLAGIGADAKLLLGAGHGVVGGRAGGVVTDDAGLVDAVGASAVGGGCSGRGCGLAAGHAVVAVQVVLVGRGQRGVRVVVRRGLQCLLVERHGEGAVVPGALRQRHQRHVAAEQPALHRGPLRLVGVVVEVDRVDLAELLTVTAHDGGAGHRVRVAHVGDGHDVLPAAVSAAVGGAAKLHSPDGAEMIRDALKMSSARIQARCDDPVDDHAAGPLCCRSRPAGQPRWPWPSVRLFARP